MTLILVIAVPMFVDTVVQKYIEDVVGDTTFLTLSSEFIVNLLVWLIIIGFIVLLGAGGILKRFGVFGIIGHLLGSGMALKKGAKFIRPMMLCVLALLLADLVAELFA